MAQHNEIEFENELCAYLEQSGWLYSPNDQGYDRVNALYPEDVWAWLAETQPTEYGKYVKSTDPISIQDSAKAQLITRLAKTLDAPIGNGGGTLEVLRRGFKHISATYQMCQFKPATGLNPMVQDRYAANRLRVMRQVHYSTKNQKSIDLVLFVNGLPVATLELKTDFTQTVHNAINQYKNDRDPKGEPLLAYGRRALVHFAVSNAEVHMTTRLDGPKTRFLPFNKGNNGAAGNPANPYGSATSYLWEEVLQKDSLLNILGRFMHAAAHTHVDSVTGVSTTTETVLFPRYHQLQAVNALVNTTAHEGVGHKYLIQHSAGSGKTNSIAWTAHQLSNLHVDGVKVFDSVIVVTDRTVLDDQLQKAIKEIDQVSGVVATITSNGGSKSEQLATALAHGKPIIVVTIQTFPFVFGQLNSSQLAGKKFAIIADEAHSSQTGGAAANLRSVLNPQELADLEDGGEISTEELLAAAMAGKAMPTNISFYAFTATPKAKTLELFGRPGFSGLPEAFHVYTMQQAIEEGFILDVLRNYTPYSLAYKLTHNGQDYDSTDIDSTKVDQSEAVKQLMRWVRLHPTNIDTRVDVIIEHFRSNVAHLLEGKAKAMVVTSSRKEAVRYMKSFEKLIAKKKYTDIAALVAFSGEVDDPESGPDKFTESTMNPGLNGRSIPDAFGTDDYQILLVANKYQTGFDQPLLSAMYVDKKLSGVNAVQTLSRLNRMYPGKEITYVVDFVNNADDIRDAFLPYYRDAQLANVTDPNLVHDIQAKLDTAGIYFDGDVTAVVTAWSAYTAAKLKNKGKTKPGGNSALYAAVVPARDRFAVALNDARVADDKKELDRLIDFRKTVESFLKTYAFLSQIYNYEDTDLEKRYIFLTYLSKVIRDETVFEQIDLSQVELTAVAVSSHATRDIQLGDEAQLPGGLTNVGSATPHDPVLVLLREVIDQMNELWDTGTKADAEGFVVWVAGKVEEQDQIVAQARDNQLGQFLSSPDLVPAIMQAVFESNEGMRLLNNEVLNSSTKLERFAQGIGKYLYEKINSQAA